MAMSCGGCHQNSNDTKIAPNVNWLKSKSFVHVDEQGNQGWLHAFQVLIGCQHSHQNHARIQPSNP
jgi:hypothetical protein